VNQPTSTTMPTRPGRRVGIDVGSVRVGVAASDPSGLLATPVRTVARDPDSTTEHPTDLEEVADVVAELAAVEVVVGLPRTLAGAEGAAADAARTYAGRLSERIAPVPVRLVDERLTTVDAHRNLRESGVDGRRQRSVVDQAAAVLILQTALDTERSSGRPPGELVRTGGRKPRTKDRRR
jgi:putative Holliday junction resolvase